MADLIRIIMDDIATYSFIKATDIGIEEKSKGFWKPKKYLHVFGVVNSELAKNKVDQIVRNHAGNTYNDILNELKVDEKLV